MELSRTRSDVWVGRLRNAWQASGLPAVLPIYLAVRVGLACWMAIVRQVFDQPLPPDPIARPYLGVAIETSPWLEPWQRWDTLHYQAIAERGYAAFDTALFAPPLYPVLVRLTSAGTGGNTLAAALLVSNLAALLGLAAFHSLALRETDSTERSKRAVLYLSIFPTALFWFAGYTESLTLLFTSLAVLWAGRSRWMASGLAAGLAGLTRLAGALGAIPVGVYAWLAARRSRSWRPWAAVIAAVLGAAAFPLYAWLGLGRSPLAPFAAQAARSQGSIAPPGLNLLQAAVQVAQGKAGLADYFDLAFLLLFIGLAMPVWRRMSRPLAIFYLASLGLYLCRTSNIAPLLGSARYVLMLLPAYLVLAEIGERPAIHRLIVYASLAGLLLLSGQFAIWGWVG